MRNSARVDYGALCVKYLILTGQDLRETRDIFWKNRWKGLQRKIKRYIISIGDIRRIRNGWALFSAIIINSLLYMSVAINFYVFWEILFLDSL